MNIIFKNYTLIPENMLELSYLTDTYGSMMSQLCKTLLPLFFIIVACLCFNNGIAVFREMKRVLLIKIRLALTGPKRRKMLIDMEDCLDIKRIRLTLERKVFDETIQSPSIVGRQSIGIQTEWRDSNCEKDTRVVRDESNEVLDETIQRPSVVWRQSIGTQTEEWDDSSMEENTIAENDKSIEKLPDETIQRPSIVRSQSIGIQTEEWNDSSNVEKAIVEQHHETGAEPELAAEKDMVHQEVPMSETEEDEEDLIPEEDPEEVPEVVEEPQYHFKKFEVEEPIHEEEPEEEHVYPEEVPEDIMLDEYSFKRFLDEIPDPDVLVEELMEEIFLEEGPEEVKDEEMEFICNTVIGEEHIPEEEVVHPEEVEESYEYQFKKFELEEPIPEEEPEESVHPEEVSEEIEGYEEIEYNAVMEEKLKAEEEEPLEEETYPEDIPVVAVDESNCTKRVDYDALWDIQVDDLSEIMLPDFDEPTVEPVKEVVEAGEVPEKKETIDEEMGCNNITRDELEKEKKPVEELEAGNLPEEESQTYDNCRSITIGKEEPKMKVAEILSIKEQVLCIEDEAKESAVPGKVEEKLQNCEEKLCIDEMAADPSEEKMIDEAGEKEKLLCKVEKNKENVEVPEKTLLKEDIVKNYKMEEKNEENPSIKENSASKEIVKPVRPRSKVSKKEPKKDPKRKKMAHRPKRTMRRPKRKQDNRTMKEIMKDFLMSDELRSKSPSTTSRYGNIVEDYMMVKRKKPKKKIPAPVFNIVDDYMMEKKKKPKKRIEPPKYNIVEDYVIGEKSNEVKSLKLEVSPLSAAIQYASKPIEKRIVMMKTSKLSNFERDKRKVYKHKIIKK